MIARNLYRRLRRLFSSSKPRRRSFALGQLDLKLREFLPSKGENGGFFVEAGANDGVSQSNTLYFEKYCGWRGLLIEPIPELVEICRANRPDSIVEQAALVPSEYASETIRMRYCNLMSIVCGALNSRQAEQDHIDVGMRVQPGVVPYEVDVPAKPLSVILDRHGVTRIDLLSLDVEGFELQVLRGVDFDRHRPNFMLIEARFRHEIESFFRGRYRTVAQLSERDFLYSTPSH